jgi:hypothetical protein
MYTPISDSNELLLLSQTVDILKNQNIGFFSSFSWYKNLIDTVIKKDNVSCAFFHSSVGEALNDAILPIIIQHQSDKTTIKSLTNYYSPIYSIDLSKFNENFFGCFLKSIRHLKWMSMEFRPMAFDDIFHLRNIFKKYGLFSVPFFCFGNWYLPVCGRSYSEYFLGLSSQVKNTVIRKTKKFNNTPGARIEIFKTSSDLDSLVNAFQKVYQTSWKQPEPYPDFIPGLIKTASEQGCLRLGIAYYFDIPIASQLWIVADNSAYIFKLAYDEAYKHYSAGTVLTSKLFECVIDEDKVDVIDYLCGDDFYKKDWMSHRRERWGLLVFNLTNLHGLILFCKEMPKYWIKHCISFLKTRLNYEFE